MKRYFSPFAALGLAVTCFGIPVIAQEEPKSEVKSEAVVIAESGTSLEEVEKKVIDALEKAGASNEVKERVLKNLARSQDSAKKQAEKIKERAEQIKEQVNKSLSFRFDEDAFANRAKGLNTRVLRMMGDQKYRIGVRSSLSVDENGDETSSSGLVIDDVVPDSPAEKAGIKSDDVLMKADKEELKSIEQLTKAIQVAGKNGKEVEIELKRGDEVITINVKPAEMKDMDSVVEDVQLNLPQAGWVFGQGQDPSIIRIPRMVDPDSFDELKKEIEELRDEIREIKDMLKDLKK